MSYDYFVVPEPYSMSDASMIAVLSFLMVFSVVMLALATVMYIFQSVSLYKIAKRRGLRLYGFAWVPVLVAHTIGSIADDYDMAIKGEKRNQRSLLLVLAIVTFIVGIVSGVASSVMPYMVNASISYVFLAVWSILYAAVAVVYCVFFYIAMYKVFRSCNPRTGVVFLVLSIVVNVTQPFFLFADRNKDLGMPQNRLPQGKEEQAEPQRPNRDYPGNF